MNLRAAAEQYIERGWCPIPLRLDANGKPKAPFTSDWQHTTRETALELPWEQAVGIGIVLGPASGNLCAIDLDNNSLAAAVLGLLRDSAKQEHRWITTGRNNGHLYLTEDTPSQPHNFWIDWRGTPVKIELKAQGQQVAAPPTSGYTSVWGETPFVAHDGIRGVWNALARMLGVGAAPESTTGGGGHFPSPWQERVTAGERNEALYVEAHKLREAGMTERTAVSMLLSRVRDAYDGADFPEREVVATVRNAYKKGVVRVHVGWITG